MTSILIQVRSKPIEFRAGEARVNVSGGSGRVPARSGLTFALEAPWDLMQCNDQNGMNLN